MPHATPVNDQSFKQTIEAGIGLALADFWAPWCAPCVFMGPIIDEAAAKHSDQLLVTKVNIDDSPETANRYNIRSIPTFVFFRDGAEIARHTGVLTRPLLDIMVERHTSLATTPTSLT